MQNIAEDLYDGEKRHVSVFTNAPVFQSCYTVPLSLSAVMLRYRWTGEAFCFKWLTLPYFESWYLALRTVHSYSFSYHSNCSQHYAGGPATAALLQTCWHLVLSQLQAPWRTGHCLHISAGFVKILLHSSRLLFTAVDSRNFCVVSVSLRGICACLLSTWQHWISIGPLSTICSFMVH